MPDMLNTDWFGEDLEPEDSEGSDIDLGDIGRLGGGGGGGNQGNESGGGGTDD